MNEWLLLLFFLILGLLALPIILYPLRQSKSMLLIVSSLATLSLSFAYCYWGAWPAWRNYVHRQANMQQLEAILQTIKGPAELIEKMRMRLKEDPKNARGWYLLGRLYASQAQWEKAGKAFRRAHQLNPNDELAAVNYAQSLLQLNQQHFNRQIKTLLKTVLQKNPNQPDALSMLAMASFRNFNYRQAIHYWQQLLKLVPEQSEDAKLIRKAIAKAQQLQ